MNILPVSTEDREELRQLADMAGAARDASMVHFRAESERVEAAGGNWSEYVENVLFAGLNPEHNDLRQREDSARDALHVCTEALSKKYSFIGYLSFGLSPSGKYAMDTINRRYREALVDSVRDGMKSEYAPVFERVMKSPAIVNPNALAPEQWVADSKTGALYRVTRQTHKGKRVMATNEHGAEERLKAGYDHPGPLGGSSRKWICLDEQDANAYREMNVEYKRRLAEVGITPAI